MNAGGVVAMLLVLFSDGGKQRCLHRLVVATELPFEGEEVKPEHVEGRHAGGEEPDKPQHWEGIEGLSQDFIFAPEACQRRDSADRDATDKKGDGGNRHLLAQATHEAHVLSQDGFVTHHVFHGMDDGPRAQKQHCFEKSVRHQMEHSGNRSSAAHGQHHVAELGHGAVGQTFFEVHLG